MNSFEIGQEIETTIVAVSGDYIFIDLNAKTEGILEAEELTDSNGQLTVKEGDTIKAFFLGFQNGEMRFTSKLSGDKIDKTLLEKAWKNNLPVEGLVEKEIKGGYEVKLGTARAFCPHSQMGYRQKEESKAYVGKQLPFRIQEFTEDGQNILVSNRIILEEEYQKKIEELEKTLKEGMTVKGTVVSVQKYGAFIDIGGFQALLPISEISLERIDNIHDVIKEGEEVEASIIKIDWPNERVSVSTKALLDDPWDTAAKKYPLESKHTGTVARVAAFGVFVTLEPGLDGLIHISELDESKKGNLRKEFKPGETIPVQIKHIDQAQKRLSLKPASSNEQEAATQKYLSNQESAGTDTYNPFAAFVMEKKGKAK